MNTTAHFAESIARLEPVLALHIVSALSALVLGGFILWGRKGNGTHRWMGQTWVGFMGVAALTSVFVGGGQLPNIAGFSPIHALTLLVLWQLPQGVLHARRGNIAAHRKTMRSMYIGGCVVAGLFTLLPSRFLGDLLWHQALGLAI